MIKVLLIISIFLINNCSFDKRSGIWTQDENFQSTNEKIENLFEKEKNITNELNIDFLINTPLKLENKKKIGSNNYGLSKIDLDFKKFSKYKFSKIIDFKNHDPKLVFYNSDLIFFNRKGSIIRFDNNSKEIWKKNYYSKTEKKNLPILNFSISKNNLIVTDNLSKYYSIDVETGELLWTKNHDTIFISDIKIDRDRFYVADSSNTLFCFSMINGSKIWEFNTDYELIKSQKKLSIVFDETNLYFNNSIGNLYSLDKENGDLIWITPTKNPNENFQSFLLKSSKIELDNENIFISNNQNSLFSIDKRTGFINWRQNISSEIKPIIIDNLIVSISSDGLFFIVEKNSGNILRITNVYDKFKLRKRKKIKPTGLILDRYKALITLNNGKILLVNINNGRTQSIHKLSNNKISRPFINRDSMFVVKDNEIIKLN